MKHFLLYIAAFCLLSWVSPGSALSVLEPYPHMVCSQDGRFCFKMIPVQDCETVGKGQFFYVTSDSVSNRLLWETKGWYAYKLFVHPGGHFIVRIGYHEPPGMFTNCEKKKPASEIMIAFYQDGQLTRSYTAAELIKDPAKAVHKELNVDVYKFFSDISGFAGENKEKFRVVSVDNIEYVFDVATGAIVLRLPLK